MRNREAAPAPISHPSAAASPRQLHSSGLCRNPFGSYCRNGTILPLPGGNAAARFIPFRLFDRSCRQKETELLEFKKSRCFGTAPWPMLGRLQDIPLVRAKPPRATPHVSHPPTRSAQIDG
jgi:hypothetical protein